ncbi:hypothetical protein B0T18DRAFT_429412 [Schizothecium vesticola]|uniref:Metallo-beta-lactamase domain-containing protein n=1 Tax=Schizothecium vesticola TaxID=314040 RepID=A0AA40K5N9_9PEZI|nr:hypothetical protein B0T18DRAFT_429412 [Schizothecium vesticola]
MTSSSSNPKTTDDLLICTACGTQFPTADRASLTTCFICDDPRQYTPGAGQSFTTLAAVRAAHANEFHPVPDDPRLISIVTTPKLAIGQRAVLLRTPAGNILWDCLTLLDDATVAEYYSTHIEWAEEFGCPVYLSAEDRKWTARSSERQVFLDQVETSIQVGGVDTGIKAIKLGGHFPGSLVLLYEKHLLVADTLMITPAGLANWAVDALGEPRARPPGVNTFAFMFSIPNMIPLSPDEIVRMWEVLKDYEFERAHGAFVGQEVRGSGVKARVLESMQIQMRHMGWKKHPFLHSLW